MESKKTPEATCVACSSGPIIRDVEAIEGFCSACGFVISQDGEGDPPEYLPTQIGGQHTEPKSWGEVAKIRSATDERLANAFGVIEEIAKRLPVNLQIRRVAADIYCAGILQGDTDGRQTASFVAACLRIASQKEGEPIPVGRLSESESIEERKVRQSCDAIWNTLGENSPISRPQDYIPHVDKSIDLTADEARSLEKLLVETECHQSFSGKCPAGIAAAGAYVVKIGLTQKEVADVVGVSPETIRLRVEDIRGVTDRE
jgi:transcription initiation factor TFIIIB Brf1 subunit/transcription initiation factor TFIIB